MTEAIEAPAQIRFQATPLQSAPEVTALLLRLELGEFRPETLTSFGGRNDNWAGTTTNGSQVFVKTAARSLAGVSPELDRALAFERLALHLPEGSALRVPQHLGSDRAGSVSAYQLLPGARSGSEVAIDGGFDEVLCSTAGRALATLHRLDPEALALDRSPPPLPPLSWLDGFPWEQVHDRSMAQIAAWQLVQQDLEVVSALRELREKERSAPKTPAHCDVRFDQFIVHNGNLYLCDWEECRMADPARDVGAFIGEWLFQATYTVFTPTSPDAPPLNAVPDHQGLVERGAANLRSHLPNVAAFWVGYLAEREPDPGLPERATAFAGWHLFDRLIATAQAHAVLSPVARAAAGVGRTLLLNPAAATQLLQIELPGRSTS